MLGKTPELISHWIGQQALPLWSQAGWDARTGTVWEVLDHGGEPRQDCPRRLRVQARQAYCFASAADQAPHLPDLMEKAETLFRFAMTKGIDPETGHLAGLLNPDCSIRTAPHDLYDIAFMLLAASALIGAGGEIGAELAQLEQALARLKAPRGWWESAEAAGGDGRRRQNPHMHMFECSTALYEATGEPRFLDMAQEALGLFREVFLQPDGIVLEYFTADWGPVAEGQAVEPGHMAEWVYLLDRFETVSGCDSGVDLMRIFDQVLAARDAAGALPDRSQPRVETRRFWPQTEFLKASIALTRRGQELPSEAQPDLVLDMLWRDYLEGPVTGGWYDKRHCDGALLSDTMPASTFYHILVAFDMYRTQPWQRESAA